MTLSSTDQIINGVKINFVHGGSGQTVVLFPGWPSNFTVNDESLQFLSQRFQVYGINIPGFGKSGPLSNGATFDDLVSLFSFFLEQNRLEKVDLIGMSFGGAVAIKLAAMSPEKVNSLVLVAPAVYYHGLLARARKLFSLVTFPLFRLLLNDFLLTKIVSNDFLFPCFYSLVTTYDLSSPESQRDYKNNRESLREVKVSSCLRTLNFLKTLDLQLDATKVKAKTLVFICNNDSFVGDSPKVLKESIKDCQLVSVEAEHWGIITSQTYDTVTNFLNDSPKY